jgi:glycosyltransferase involved in cell wall biosynthesis
MTLKLLFLSDRIIGGPSAYSKDTFEMTTRLAAKGYKVAHTPMGFANRMGKQAWRDVLINESGDQAFGEDVAIQHYLDFKADMLITNKEPWVFNDIYKYAINFVPIAVIDHSPVSVSITARLTQAFKVIAQSHFGQMELRRKNIESEYIPLGVRTDIYRPLNKAECKKAFYFEPDEFIIGIVALNRARKMIPQMLRGYKRFLELNPDVKAHLMLWTDVRPSRPPADVSMGVADVGVNLLPEIYELGLGQPPNDVRWTKWEEVKRIGGIPEWDPSGRWDMVKLYNAFDVNLLCSGGEGAGKPYLEAAACGVGSLYTNYAAAPEYAGSSGIPVNANDYVIIVTPGTRYYIPDVDQMAEALTKMYNADREKVAKRARMHAERFDWAKVIDEYWIPFLEKCEVELHPKVTKEGVVPWN